MLYHETLKQIGGLNEEAMLSARDRMDNLIKPPGSLGLLEEIAVKVAGIIGNPRPQIGKRSVIVMAGDHGVINEGVSAAPQDVTWQMLPAFINGVAGIGVLARHAGASIAVVDVGVATDVEIPGVMKCRVKSGADNIAQGPAMTREEAVAAVEVGIRVALREIEQGATLLALGDMGIGNTTPSTAILAALGGYSVAEVTGRGTMVNDEVLGKKRQAVTSALTINNPDSADGLDVLAKVGGLEIAGLAGVVLACASKRVPVLVDGFITGAAALIAAAIEPKTKYFMLASHLSGEPGHKLMLEMLGLKPMLNMGMRLGEGTGAALAMHIVEAACRVLNEMVTFAEAGVVDMEEDKLLKG
ncbi:nicotinate-nucleotide-dimethylbenzimidazole phosphoribosyltransferase [Desulfotomaculum arcticum]|uniref:Nicotinate-nucleotide--dimethylbenzimidazole phosphoribosyltransferase n=1 Tax=Desulfotruncus arcticus DSM 17038 TaxID=1121424 RepID=A0A1I2ZM66_9FIRM|nr:nicotinate-nucleotide--dimethylbenzimidazole phosphoribosyltransferase [Desulfotruncus arcticus]SFH38171.1 nicotinate-nucleotide-dimethylbenzimidazole phosphoribosyltransferase [Desulfotomaculum arcticum] [Desulfotruncus arcticus DSM 17038]